MSYLVLARKYRPRSFDAMVGQEHVVQALANALNQQRLHHAYLFTGTRGVGKTTVSRILAKSLNCTGADGQGGITASPCGVCNACRDIDSGRFVDYVELDAASNRGVEEITQLLDQAVYKPVMGRFKVYMVDEVHMLSNHAFNAMLKTLEEPPEYLKFVLATTDPQKVPPTVLSRCLQFNLRPMALATLHSHLAQVLGEEGIGAEAGALRLIARAARGSMRDALSLTDQAIAFGAGALAEAGVRQMLGAVDRGHAQRLLEALAAADGPALLAAIDGLRALGLSAAGTLEEMAEVLQQMAVAQAVPTAVQADDGALAETLRLAALFGADETALLYSMCLHGRAELGLAPDEYGGLTMVLLRMLAFRPSERRAAAAPSPSPSNSAPRPAVPLQAPQVAKAIVPVSATVGATAARAVPSTVQRTTPPPVAPVAPVALPPTRVQPTPTSAEPASPAKLLALSADAEDDMPPWLDAPESDGADDAVLQRAVASNSDVDLSPAAPAVAARLQDTPLGERWAEAVNALVSRGSITALVRELAWQAQCIAITEPDSSGGAAVWRLRVEREMLRAPTHAERLQTALADWLQSPVRLETEGGLTTDTPALRATAERDRRQQAAEASIARDPLVLSLLAQYKTARIVPGSVQPC